MRGLWTILLSALALGSYAVHAPVQATPFGPATAGFTFTSAGGNPNVPYLIGPSSGSVTLGAATRTTGVSGTFVGVLTGSSSGTINFSTTVGTTVALPAPALFTFNDPLGGLYSFDAVSVRTTSLDQNVLEGTDNFQLYILGTVAGGSLAYEPTDTSVVFNLAGFLGQSSNYSLVLSNPPEESTPPGPAVVAEPSGIAVFGVALVALVVFSRTRRDGLAEATAA